MHGVCSRYKDTSEWCIALLVLQVLLIDEISMVSGELLDWLDHFCRVVRGRDQPFGGMQLILSGDFCQ